MLMILAEDFGAILAELGDYESAVRLLGAADAMRERSSHPRAPAQQVEIEEPFAKARAALDAQAWEREYERGRTTTVEDALRDVYDRTGPDPLRAETSGRRD
jgi:hypothetical protein